MVVIDADSNSAEVRRKWRRHQSKNLRKKDRRPPLGIDVFLCDAFVQCGVKVVRPVGADADAVLAALAARPECAVLSRDQDFHRYDHYITVVSEWTVSYGRLTLGTEVRSKDCEIVDRSVQFSLAEKALERNSVWCHPGMMAGAKYRPSFLQVWFAFVSCFSLLMLR